MTTGACSREEARTCSFRGGARSTYCRTRKTASYRAESPRAPSRSPSQVRLAATTVQTFRPPHPAAGRTVSAISSLQDSVSVVHLARASKAMHVLGRAARTQQNALCKTGRGRTFPLQRSASRAVKYVQRVLGHSRLVRDLVRVRVYLLYTPVRLRDRRV